MLPLAIIAQRSVPMHVLDNFLLALFLIYLCGQFFCLTLHIFNLLQLIHVRRQMCTEENVRRANYKPKMTNRRNTKKKKMNWINVELRISIEIDWFDRRCFISVAIEFHNRHPLVRFTKMNMHFRWRKCLWRRSTGKLLNRTKQYRCVLFVLNSHNLFPFGYAMAWGLGMIFHISSVSSHAELWNNECCYIEIKSTHLTYTYMLRACNARITRWNEYTVKSLSRSLSIFIVIVSLVSFVLSFLQQPKWKTKKNAGQLLSYSGI